MPVGPGTLRCCRRARFRARMTEEGGPGFLRLANALAALYPASNEEKRLLEAILLAAPK